MPANAHEYVANNLPSFTQYYERFQQDGSKQALFDAVADVIRHQPQYTFLSSFGVSAPEQAEQPLSPATFAMRSREIEEQTSRRFHLRPSDFFCDPNADLHNKRGQLRLTLQTEPVQHSRTPDHDSAFEHFNNWLLDTIREDIDHFLASRGLRAPVGNIIGIRALQASAGLVSDLELYTDKNETIPDAVSLIRNILSTALLSSYSSQPYELPELAPSMVMSFAHNLYSGTYRGFADTLEATLQQHTGAAVAQILPAVRWINTDILACLRRPQGPLCTTGDSAHGRSMSHINDPAFAARVIAKDKIHEHESKVIGTVAVRSPRALDMRLITHQTAKSSYPIKAGLYDLQIDLTDQNITNEFNTFHTAPAIPGMEVVARKGDTWYFAMTNHDPYKGSSRIPVLDEHRITLARHYKEAGLTELSTALEKHQGALTVADLVRYIRNNTRYTYDVNLPQAQSASSRIADFSPYVQDGLLHAQCSGSAAFLAASLRIALPGSITKSIQGYILPRHSNSLTAVRHEQVSYTYDNKLYIMDATATDDENHAIREGAAQREAALRPTIGDLGRFALQNTQRILGRTRRPSTPSPKISPKNHMTVEQMYQHSEQRLAGQHQQLEKTLQTVFKAKNQQILYEKLAGLSTNDPNRLAVAAFYQAQHGNWQALHQTHALLQDYLGLEVHERNTVLRQYQIPHYSDSHLKLLAERLAAATRLAPRGSRS
ncbi:MAG TPA: hypothetical protein VFT53_06880 [Candidatus Saccharimonadales bacterium]|nr:hypothetical protein [Candidatus Saccharimonadales bacterium]